MRLLNHLLLVILLLVTSSCDKPNVLTEYSKTDSDEAWFMEAQKKMDAFQWDEAIDILTQNLSVNFRATVKAKERLMHAYGGKCGISFFDMIQALKTVNSNKMFDIALKIFAHKEVHVAACDAAIGVLHDIGLTAADRTANQNTFAAILGLTRMGTTIKAKIDPASLDTPHPGQNLNACENQNTPLYLSDADMDRIASGVGLIFENLAALGEALTSGSAGVSFANAKALCETPLELPAIGQPNDYISALPPNTPWSTYGLSDPPNYSDFGISPDIADPLSCTNTVDALVPAKMRRLLRRLISSSSAGVGSCDLGVVDVEGSAVVNPHFDSGQPEGINNPRFLMRLNIKPQCCEDLPVP